jgi:hypothetical protein
VFLLLSNDSEEEKDMRRAVEKRGGVKACTENDKMLKELEGISRKHGSKLSYANIQRDSRKQSAEQSFASLKKEVKDDNHDIDQLLKSNKVVFERKLEMQMRQIIAETAEVVTRESDRVISAVISGPHDRINDSVSQTPCKLCRFILTDIKDLHALWVEMVWFRQSCVR